MPAPVGSDRLSRDAQGRLLLSTPLSKGWKARRPRTPQAAEYPGTAIRWEEEIYEVLDREILPAGGVRYVLAPWDDRHTIRVCQTYDEAGERARREDRRTDRERERNAAVSLLLAPLVGLFPTAVQERMEREWGVRASLLTGISLVLPLAAGSLSVVMSFLAGFVALSRLGLSGIPPGVFLLGNYLFAESLVRLAIVAAQSRPIGSLLGIPLWGLCRTLKLGPAPESPPPGGAPLPGPSAARLASDRYAMLEPLLAFLPASAQEVLSRRFGFDALDWGRRGAWLLLVFTGLALPGRLLIPAGAPGSGVFGSLLLVYLAGEQVWRLRRLAAGSPAPGALGLIVAPFARPLLEPENGPPRPVDSAG